MNRFGSWAKIFGIVWSWTVVIRPGVGFNIKTVFLGIMIPVMKIRRLWDCLIFIMGIHILVRQLLYIETIPLYRIQYKGCFTSIIGNPNVEIIRIHYTLIWYINTCDKWGIKWFQTRLRQDQGLNVLMGQVTMKEIFCREGLVFQIMKTFGNLLFISWILNRNFRTFLQKW